MAVVETLGSLVIFVFSHLLSKKIKKKKSQVFIVIKTIPEIFIYRSIKVARIVHHKGGNQVHLLKPGFPLAHEFSFSLL